MKNNYGKIARIYFAGTSKVVTNKSGEPFEIYNNGRLKASGDTLFNAVKEFDEKRTCCDDIAQAFKNSDFYKEVKIIYDEDGDFLYEEDMSYNEQYDKFIKSLTGEEYFDIVRDGTYDCYVNWNEIPDDDEDEEDEDDE